MNFYFPDRRILFVAENASHTLHNTLTLRGALVRDPRVWAHYLNQTIEEFGREAEVMFACHHWPRWGTDRIVDFLSKQRDLYGYLHDQTLRLINQGYTGNEIAERFELPPSLAQAWHCRGYYGSVSHNVKAVYQLYMGWFDGNPAHLWEHPTVEAAERYVEFMGGAEAVLEKARDSFDAGDFRWVAQVVNHVIFADPDNAAASELQAAALDPARLRGRERELAKLLPDRGEGAARGSARNPDLRRCRGHHRPALARSSSSTRWRSGSMDRGRGASGSSSTGPSTRSST